MQYVVIIEETIDGGFSAYVPDLPLCFTVGDSVEDVKRHIKDAIETYLDEVRSEGIAIPKPSVQAALVDV